MAELADEVHVDAAILDYVSRLAEETRRHVSIRLGLSVRGCLAFVRCAKTWAISQGRDHVVPDDIKLLAQPVLNHRLLVTAEAPVRRHHRRAGHHPDPRRGGTTHGAPRVMTDHLDDVGSTTRRSDLAPAAAAVVPGRRRRHRHPVRRCAPAPGRMPVPRRARQARAERRPPVVAAPAHRLAGAATARHGIRAAAAAGRDAHPHDHAAARSGADRAHPHRGADPACSPAAGSGRSPSRPGRCGTRCSRCCAGSRRSAGPCSRSGWCRGGSPPATPGSSWRWSPSRAWCSCWPACALAVGRARVRIRVDVEPTRVTVGDPATGRIEVTNTSRRGLLPLLVELPVGDTAARFALPTLGAGRAHEELFVVPTRRRGVVPVGPATTVHGDPLGLVRRTRGVDRAHRAVRAPVHRVAREPRRRAAARPRGRGDARPVDVATSRSTRCASTSPATTAATCTGARRPSTAGCSCGSSSTPGARTWRSSSTPAPRCTPGATDDVELAISCAASLALRSILDEQDTTVVVQRPAAPRARPRR